MAEPEIAGFQPESYEILHPKANRIFTLSILINVFRLVQAGLSTADFYRRLVTACASRWGLVIELLVDAIVYAIERGHAALSSAAFCAAFTRRTGLEEGFSPFSISDYEDLFRHRQMIELWERNLRE